MPSNARLMFMTSFHNKQSSLVPRLFQVFSVPLHFRQIGGFHWKRAATEAVWASIISDLFEMSVILWLVVFFLFRKFDGGYA